MSSLAASLPPPLVLLVAALFVTAEAGLLIGIVLPGASALFVLGVLAHHGTVKLPLAAVTGSVAAVAGAQWAYWNGRRARDLRPTTPRHAKAARALEMFEQGGPAMVSLCQWIVAARTLAPRLAGRNQLRYATFTAYNAPSALLWGTAWVLCGAAGDEVRMRLDRWLGTAPLLLLGAAAALVAYRTRRSARP